MCGNFILLEISTPCSIYLQINVGAPKVFTFGTPTFIIEPFLFYDIYGISTISPSIILR